MLKQTSIQNRSYKNFTSVYTEKKDNWSSKIFKDLG